MIHEKKGRLETIEYEIKDARREMDRLWRIIETTENLPADPDLWMKTTSERRRSLEAPRPSSLIAGPSGPTWRLSWQTRWT